MLFTSFGFIFVFLPLTLIAYQATRHWVGFRPALALLSVASLIFYGWWNPSYLLLLAASILFNFAVSQVILTRKDWARVLLVVGIAVNLGAIAYYKYANFFLGNVDAVFGTNFQFAKLLLPLGISFFTFTQIAYLVDIYIGRAHERDFLGYVLFVVFFPHLIAGPIVHHAQLMPQFTKPLMKTGFLENLAFGGSIFVIGLFKKAVLADGVSTFADAMFNAADAGQAVSAFTAWAGTLAYAFQIYFDFSGYSDMAIGLAWMFSIRLPINFFSPYRSRNIIEFWRRWHMTLSRFLRDYLYIPLGGNRKGKTRRYVNLMATMLLGGLWHGAGWTFVIWGGLHGLYLVVNHAWIAVKERLSVTADGTIIRIGCWAVTFFAVLQAWVFFRAKTLDGAMRILHGMWSRKHPLIEEAVRKGLPDEGMGAHILVSIAPKIQMWQGELVLLMLLGSIAFVLPNSMQIFNLQRDDREDALERRVQWQRNTWWVAALAVMFCMCIYCLMAQDYEEFIYWNF